MNKIENIHSQSIKFGDTAVDGLISGIWAGIAMAIFIIIAGWLMGDSPLTSVNRFSINPTTTPWMAVITHLAVSAVYGLVYALIMTAISRFASSGKWTYLISGVLYGFNLWLLANTVLLSAFSSSLGEVPWITLIIGHLLYGFVLGFSMSSKVIPNS